MMLDCGRPAANAASLRKKGHFQMDGIRNNS